MNLNHHHITSTSPPGTDRLGERTARAAWSVLAEPGDRDAHTLISTHGPSGALAEVEAGKGLQRWQERLPALHTGGHLDTLHALGGRLLIPGDDEWPPALQALGADTPFCLWTLGPLDLASATSRAVALVGSRASTACGERIATELGDGCASRGITVVSGAAYVLYLVSCC